MIKQMYECTRCGRGRVWGCAQSTESPVNLEPWLVCEGECSTNRQLKVTRHKFLMHRVPMERYRETEQSP